MCLITSTVTGFCSRHCTVRTNNLHCVTLCPITACERNETICIRLIGLVDCNKCTNCNANTVDGMHAICDANVNQAHATANILRRSLHYLHKHLSAWSSRNSVYIIYVRWVCSCIRVQCQLRIYHIGKYHLQQY